MNNETETYKDYTIHIAQDKSPSNLFEEFDCEPPIITYYGGRHGYAKSYCGAPETISEIVDLMPASCFERGNRVKLIKEHLNCTMKEFVECYRSQMTIRDAFIELLIEQVGSTPSGWRDAITWFEMAEGLLKEAGIPCLNGQSNGYSQGYSTLVLVIATPEWRKLTGVEEEGNIKTNLRGAFDLYSAWAWGDVYGIEKITAPPAEEDGEGEELEEGSVWGYYGSDHEKSGLLESARSSIDWHINHLKEVALNEPACHI